MCVCVCVCMSVCVRVICVCVCVCARARARAWIVYLSVELSSTVHQLFTSDRMWGTVASLLFIV